MFKKLFVLFLMVLLTFGCALMEKVPTEDSPCAGVAEGDSYICSIVPNPQDADFLLRLANAGALEADVYTAEQALSTVDKLINVVEDGKITYADLYKLVLNDVSPLVFVVVDEYSGQFMGLDVVLKAKDIELILIHLKRQRALISIALLSAQLNQFMAVL
ncbi:MAG: hypothetical protein ACYTBJ_00890 [Planctomycetota bacterium]|jgi:hypothetical protein